MPCWCNVLCVVLGCDSVLRCVAWPLGAAEYPVDGRVCQRVEADRGAPLNVPWSAVLGWREEAGEAVHAGMIAY